MLLTDTKGKTKPEETNFQARIRKELLKEFNTLVVELRMTRTAALESAIRLFIKLGGAA